MAKKEKEIEELKKMVENFSIKQSALRPFCKICKRHHNGVCFFLNKSSKDYKVLSKFYVNNQKKYMIPGNNINKVEETEIKDIVPTNKHVKQIKYTSWVNEIH